MARDLRSLDRRLEATARRLTAAVEDYVSDVFSEIGRRLVPATPVDTGLARGNWRPSIGVPVSRPTSLVDPTGAGAIARIESTARQYRTGETLYLVNRVPYIGQLNAGSSRQAPAGFVQSKVREGFNAATARRRGGVL
jgi:hypothetical protein